jgi:hypothetical protein
MLYAYGEVFKDKIRQTRSNPSTSNQAEISNWSRTMKDILRWLKCICEGCDFAKIRLEIKHRSMVNHPEVQDTSPTFLKVNIKYWSVVDSKT